MTRDAKPKPRRQSRKQRVRALFEAEGIKPAWTLGLRLKLKPGSLRTWFARWHRAAQSAKSASKEDEHAHVQ